MRSLRVQDAVHGMMEFEGAFALVVRLLDTPELLRLRGIKQMGLAHYLYPSAEHSRLVHSLGVANLAMVFGKAVMRAAEQVLAPALWPRAENIRDLSIAGLVHDLGHGPFSHAWERELVGGDYDMKAWADALEIEPPADRIDWHELVTQAMVLSEQSQLHRRLEYVDSGLAERVAALLAGSYYLPYLCPLLGSDADVDRFDFMLRDALQCGLEVGHFDLERLLSTVAIGDVSSRFVVGFDMKAETAVYQYLNARVALYEIAYYHRTVRSAEGMMGLLMKRLREQASHLNARKALSRTTRQVIRAASGDPMPYPDLLVLDDNAILTAMHELRVGRGIDPTLRDLAGRLLDRHLLKDCRLADDTMKAYVDANTSVRQEIDNDVRDILQRELPSGLDPDFYWHYDQEERSIFGPGSRASGSAHGSIKDVYLIQGGRALLVRTMPRFRQIDQTYSKYRYFVPAEVKDKVGRLFRDRFRI